VLWSAVVMPSLWQVAPANDAAERVIAADRFKPGALASVLTVVEAVPVALSHPRLTRGEAVIRLRIAEEGVARKSSEQVDIDGVAAKQTLIAALGANPADAFLWLALYSIETSRAGFDPKAIAYLEQSYLAAPHEGWIAVRRNRLAVAVFPMLSDAAQAQVVNEFAELVDSDFHGDAEASLTGIGWMHRKRLLAGLDRVEIASREAFARLLSRDGYDVQIPGAKPKERPWQ